MILGPPGLEIAIEYNEANRRVTQASWVLAAGYTAWVKIWQNLSLVYERTIVGPVTGAENIPGNLRVVETTNYAGETYLDLPPEITYQINVETIG